jgi:hypothetical protein
MKNLKIASLIARHLKGVNSRHLRRMKGSKGASLGWSAFQANERFKDRFAGYPAFEGRERFEDRFAGLTGIGSFLRLVIAQSSCG